MRIILIIISVFIVELLSATPELTSKRYSERNIEIELIYRYDDDVKDLYYRTLTKKLNQQIEEIRKTGALGRGKVYLDILVGEWMESADGVEMYRYNQGYYCFLNGLIQPISYEYLSKIVKYFALENWESFCYNKEQISPKKSLEIFNSRIDTISSNINNKEIILLELNSICIAFVDDKLICKDSNKIYGEIDKFIPFSSDKRDIFAIGNEIFVVENHEIINRIKLSYDDFSGESLYQCEIGIFSKWINFRNYLGYFLSYSIEKNKFYKI